MCRMDSRKEALSPSTVEEERNSVKGKGEFKCLGVYGGKAVEEGVTAEEQV